jgi:precorrin-6B methylase 2
MADRARRYEQALRERLGIPRAARDYVHDHGDSVQAGLFAGMRYPVELLTRADCPVGKMRGTYELELWAALEQMIAALRSRSPAALVDLGCADGYYAVGLARSVPDLEVHAFDLAASARAATRALARANGTHVNLHGAGDPKALARLAPETVGLICDIEGAEVDVLTAEVATALRTSHVIVEMHEGLRPGACDTLLERFAQTHHSDVIEQRHDDDPPLGAGEMRVGGLRWGVFTPRD